MTLKPPQPRYFSDMLMQAKLIQSNAGERVYEVNAGVARRWTSKRNWCARTAHGRLWRLLYESAMYIICERDDYTWIIYEVRA